jgi:signal peptidase II
MRSHTVFNAQRRRWLVPLFLALVVLLLDQISKQWILANLGPEPMQYEIPVVGDWFSIIYSRNTGVAFGLFQNMSPLFIVVSLLISAGAIYVYATYLPNDVWNVQISLGLILGGALGNVVDRILLGYVVDFIRVGWWPVFNVADSAITVGAAVLALFLLLTPDDEPVHHEVSLQDEALLDDLLHRDVQSLERDHPQHPQG